MLTPLYFFLLLVAVRCQCNDTITVNSSSYQCRYAVDYASDDCTDPVFIQCWVLHNNHTKNYENKLICAQYCCKESSIFCPSTASQTTSVISIRLIVAVLSALVILGLTVICVYKYHSDCVRCCEESCCFRKNKVQNQQRLRMDETQISIQSEGEEWKQGENTIKNAECSVCLYQGNNLMLDCGHAFHKQCILQCLKRKYECVLCRRKDLQLFHIYCDNCGVNYRQLHPLRFFRQGSAKSECMTCITVSQMAQL